MATPAEELLAAAEWLPADVTEAGEALPAASVSAAGQNPYAFAGSSPEEMLSPVIQRLERVAQILENMQDDSSGAIAAPSKLYQASDPKMLMGMMPLASSFNIADMGVGYQNPGHEFPGFPDMPTPPFPGGPEGPDQPGEPPFPSPGSPSGPAEAPGSQYSPYNPEDIVDAEFEIKSPVMPSAGQKGLPYYPEGGPASSDNSFDSMIEAIEELREQVREIVEMLRTHAASPNRSPEEPPNSPSTSPSAPDASQSPFRGVLHGWTFPSVKGGGGLGPWEIQKGV